MSGGGLRLGTKILECSEVVWAALLNQVTKRNKIFQASLPLEICSITPIAAGGFRILSNETNPESVTESNLFCGPDAKFPNQDSTLNALDTLEY
jgi:hypothetical protein